MQTVTKTVARNPGARRLRRDALTTSTAYHLQSLSACLCIIHDDRPEANPTVGPAHREPVTLD